MSTSTAPASRGGAVVLDELTQQRLLVADATAETLERMAEGRVWSALDPAIAAHLISQSSRLRVFLSRVRATTELRRDESQMMALKRLERRLEVAEELLAPNGSRTSEPSAPETTAERQAASKVFIGDFTGNKLTKEQQEKSRERRLARKQGASGLKLSRTAKQCIAIIGAGAGVLVLSLVARIAAPSSVRHGALAKPSLAMTPNQFTEDLTTFLPVTTTMLSNGCLTIVVDSIWVSKPDAQQRLDADGAAAFLANRQVRSIAISLADGREIYRNDGKTTQFAEGGTHLAPLEDRVRGKFGPQGTVRPGG